MSRSGQVTAAPPEIAPDPASEPATAGSLTKIVATIGPGTSSAADISALRRAGVSMARLNLSHADLDWHATAIRMLRETDPDMKIRTADLAHEPVFRRGDAICLTTDPAHHGADKVLVNCDTLHGDLSPGDTVFADDGTLRFTVTRIAGRDIHCRAETGGRLRSRKGINVPFVSLGNRLLTERDREMIAFARAQEVDYIGISFVESAIHVHGIRALIGGTWPRIVSKIESQGGLRNMIEIIDASDAIMIDRGDLSVETSLENLAVMQKRIIQAARREAKPVIVATEMLHSMIDNAFPTKAEVTDIANAVFDGCAATMLSGETAIGANPAAAVSVMSRVIESAESQIRLDDAAGLPDGSKSIPEVMGEAISVICRNLPITKVVAVTIGGYAPRRVSAHRLPQPILAVSNDRMAARSFNLLPGTRGVFVDVPFSRDSTDHIAHCLESLWRDRLLSDDDVILVTSVGYPNSGNRMNLIEIHRVEDLRAALKWAH
jgi:pyruvate kinase